MDAEQKIWNEYRLCAGWQTFQCSGWNYFSKSCTEVSLTRLSVASRAWFLEIDGTQALQYSILTATQWIYRAVWILVALSTEQRTRLHHLQKFRRFSLRGSYAAHRKWKVVVSPIPRLICLHRTRRFLCHLIVFDTSQFLSRTVGKRHHSKPLVDVLFSKGW